MPVVAEHMLGHLRNRWIDSQTREQAVFGYRLVQHFSRTLSRHWPLRSSLFPTDASERKALGWESGEDAEERHARGCGNVFDQRNRTKYKSLRAIAEANAQTTRGSYDRSPGAPELR